MLDSSVGLIPISDSSVKIVMYRLDELFMMAFTLSRNGIGGDFSSVL